MRGKRLDQSEAGEVRQIHLAVGLTMPSFGLLGIGVQIAQVSIDPQFANQV